MTRTILCEAEEVKSPAQRDASRPTLETDTLSSCHDPQTDATNTHTQTITDTLLHTKLHRELVSYTYIVSVVLWVSSPEAPETRALQAWLRRPINMCLLTEWQGRYRHKNQCSLRLQSHDPLCILKQPSCRTPMAFISSCPSFFGRYGPTKFNSRTLACVFSTVLFNFLPPVEAIAHHLIHRLEERKKAFVATTLPRSAACRVMN